MRVNCDLVQGPFVAAGDIRRRLSESLSAPQALFKRDPEDPSGMFQLPNINLIGFVDRRKPARSLVGLANTPHVRSDKRELARNRAVKGSVWHHSASSDTIDQSNNFYLTYGCSLAVNCSDPLKYRRIKQIAIGSDFQGQTKIAIMFPEDTVAAFLV